MATLNSILHPHHVSLMRTPFTLHSFFHSFEDRIDPYYEYDRMHVQKSTYSPNFNVTETEAEYLIDGEFPGVIDKTKISVEWLQNQVLIIRGFIGPADNGMAKDPFRAEGLRNELQPVKQHVQVPVDSAKLEIEAMNTKPMVHFPRRLLNERQIGECQRSFTFPVEVDADNMKANLADGLLRIVVPKMIDAAPNIKSIDIQ